MTLPMLTCPHCGAQLGVSSRTSEGEVARCGECREAVVLRGGELRPVTWDDCADLVWCFLTDPVVTETAQ